MKKMFVIAIVMAATMTANLSAVGFLGTPTAEFGKGKWSLGYDYSYSSQDTSKEKAKYTIVGDETGTFKFNLRDFNLQRHYASIGYGLNDNWDVYFKLGVADLKSEGKDYELDSVWSINFDNDMAWGWGTRYTFLKQNKITWGAAIQMNWLDTESLSKDRNQKKKIYSFDSYDLLISAGPTIDMGGWKVYGGPFYYYLDGEYNYKLKDSGLLEYFESADLKADQNVGAFIGSVIKLSENLDWTVEYATTFDGWGVGTGIAWKF